MNAIFYHFILFFECNVLVLNVYDHNNRISLEIKIFALIEYAENQVIKKLTIKCTF